MKCIVKRRIDSLPSEVVSQQADTKDELKANLIRQYEADSRRAITTRNTQPDIFAEPTSCIWHYELKWEDGEVEDMVLSFPSPGATAYSDDDAVWLEMSPSIPLWATPNPYDPVRVCINDMSNSDVEDEARELVANRVRQMPSPVLSVLEAIDLEITVRCVYPDGKVFRIGCSPVSVAGSEPELPTDGDQLMSLILNELMDEGSSGDSTV